jgi:hypothetical protein
MPKQFTVQVSNGSEYKIEAQGHADAAVKLLAEPGKYPLPEDAVVGIEGPRGSARFYKRRGKARNLWPISVSAAAVELAMWSIANKS